MIESGAVVAEKYQIERVLGRGGMGVVVSAIHLQLGQRVALKFLRRDAVRDDELVARFLREARAAVQLRGEHVGKVVDVGTRMPVPLATDYVLQACVGLAEAHRAGIVHRDLKPANLFLTQRPDGSALVKVMDFGIAKAIGRMDGALTDSAAVMGSPGYMSPEQLRSARDVDARADLWSLGVVLYELTSGRRPYAANTITELAMLVATEPVPPLPASLPRSFSAVVMRCLEKDASRRFADVAALAAALAPHGTAPGAAAVARVKAGAAPLPSVGDEVDALMNATTLSGATSVRALAAAGGRPRPRLRRWWPVLALAVIAAGWRSRWSRAAERPPTGPTGPLTDRPTPACLRPRSRRSRSTAGSGLTRQWRQRPWMPTSRRSPQVAVPALAPRAARAPVAAAAVGSALEALRLLPRRQPVPRPRLAPHRRRAQAPPRPCPRVRRSLATPTATAFPTFADRSATPRRQLR